MGGRGNGEGREREERRKGEGRREKDEKRGEGGERAYVFAF
jgi:hypothetical protein